MSTIPRLLQSSLVNLGSLAQQYSELTQIKVKDSARSLSIGSVLLGVAAGLGIVVLSELTFALALWLVAGEVTAPARTASLAGVLTAVVAGLFGLVGAHYLQRIDVNPVPDGVRRKGHGPGEFDLSWETIT